MATSLAEIRARAREHEADLERRAAWHRRQRSAVPAFDPNARLLTPADVAALTGYPADVCAAYVRPAVIVGARVVRWHAEQVARWQRDVRRGRVPAPPRRLRVRGGVARTLRLLVLARDGAACGVCGDAAGPFHIDHKQPVSRGGSNAPENLWVLCARCNLQKHARTVEEFLAWRAAQARVTHV